LIFFIISANSSSTKSPIASGDFVLYECAASSLFRVYNLVFITLFPERFYGCWFESQATGRHLWICIADRGQGIFQSLVKVHPELADEQAALHAAFETIISGRAPEQRGNGLKFVKKSLSMTPGGGVACISGTGRVFYGEQGEKCVALLDKNFINVQGTVTLMVWELQ